MNKSAKYICLAMCAMMMWSCKNDTNEFPDYEGGVTAYFAYQYPVRTITLGEDLENDNSLDNDHMCRITATHSGTYKSRDLRIDIEVDNSLTDNLTFEDGTPVKAMPSEYYELSSMTLTKVKDFMFGSYVRLTDAFFADPDALKNTYVIPVRMVAAHGADQILTGTPLTDGDQPHRCDSEAWSVKPMDYVLYCVKYINPWDASYCRRGVDVITENGNVTKNVRHAQYVEKDEVVGLSTLSLSTCSFPVSAKITSDGETRTLTCDLTVTFDDDGSCSISTSTQGMTASGNGRFVRKGDKNSLGNKDRDVLYLDYTIDYGVVRYDVNDTLVVRSRDVKLETFSPIYSK